MSTVTRFQKVYFAAVGLLALWVGVWGYFIPAHVDQAIPWTVPPLHSRFLGAMYFSGMTFMIASILSRYYAEVRVAVRVIAIWTGMLFIVSLFYLSEFDFNRGQVWTWFEAYLIYPLIACWLIWRDRNMRETIPGPRLPTWAQAYLLGQGIVVTSLALALLFIPDVMVNVWPWRITRLLAQIYSAPFLAYGLCSLLLYRQKTWFESRVAVTAISVFSVLVLIASFIHVELFSFTNPAALLWFGGLLVSAVMLGFLAVRAHQVAQHA